MTACRRRRCGGRRRAILDTVGVTLAGAGEPCARIAAGVLGSAQARRRLPDLRHRPARRRRSTPRWSTAPRRTRSISTMSATRWAATPRRRSCRRCSRSARCCDCDRPRLHRRLCRRVRDRDADRAAACISIITKRAGTRPRRWACSAPPRPAATCWASTPAKTAQALAIAASLAAGIKANFGTMTKPLHVGHTARNGLFAAHAGARRLHRQCRRARTQAGLPDGVQRRRHFRRRGDLARLGQALRHRPARARRQAAPVLRQHPPGDRRDAGCCAREHEHRARQGRADRIPGRIRAASPTPTGPIRRAGSTPSSACNTAWPAR